MRGMENGRFHDYLLPCEIADRLPREGRPGREAHRVELTHGR